jgi:ribosomal-protein-alanine N-acetyltransferase
MFFCEIETERLYMKNIAIDDREFVFSQFSDNNVNEYLFDAEPLINIEGADEIIGFYMQPEPRYQHRWILVHKPDGEKIGTCGFHCWDIGAKTCEIGYDLKQAYWGRGYMTEALKAALTFAHEQMNLKQIKACISADNIRSIKLAEKLGFVFTGETQQVIFRGKEYKHNILTLDLGEKGAAL